MGDWHHPNHFTEQAKLYHAAERAAGIQVFLDMVLPSMREAAREHGYSLAVHGSLIRDLDLIAVPWTEEAGNAALLIHRMGEVVRQHTGWGNVSASDSWSEKPHGRIATTIVASFAFHIDLSVMPRVRAGGGSI